ncbi:MAG: hypothetical protein LBB88_01060 [Planctomycetaceae bacterium]|jgi:hypothetical protein|nr:hypothetical protein [Planctomycetaceae bacterium]
MSLSVIDSDSVVLSDRFGEAVVEESMMLNSPVVEELSSKHINEWNNLVSQTNWEKGALIILWRESLISAGLPKAAYSDEAWSRRVGGVSAQHVGRLRRVSERFGGQSGVYDGLFWSHFQAALDWEDAEMWLEGAVQNSWSVAQMRIQRWEAIGAPQELKPRNEDVFTAELDDDVNPRNDSFKSNEKTTESRIREIGAADIIDGFNPPDSVDPKDENGKSKKKQKKNDSAKSKITGDEIVDNDSTSILPTGEVLANLVSNAPTLPKDLAEAIESCKIAILNHKLASWKDISSELVLNCLDMLKKLVISED